MKSIHSNKKRSRCRVADRRHRRGSVGAVCRRQNDIFHNPVLSKIGAKYGKSVAQVITRWLVERDIVVLAKSTKPERMAENLNVFDFALSNEDKAEIAKLDGTFAAIVNHDTIDNLKRISAWKMGV